MNKRPFVAAVGTLAAATAVIGLLHAPCARGLLMGVGGCPLANAGRMTPSEMENARHLAVGPIRGTHSAPARPALGFTLETTTVDDVHAWAKRENASCEDAHPGLVVCKRVPASALGGTATDPAIDELALGFNKQNRLVNATTFRSRLSADVAATAAHGIAAELESRLGPADIKRGEFDARTLSQPSASSVAALSYRYSDYIAEVSAMNLPSGASVREQYMSAND